MRNFSLLSFLLVISSVAMAKDQFRCEQTLKNNKYVITGYAPYNRLGLGSVETRYVSIYKNDELISQVDLWGGMITGFDDASDMGIRVPFMVDRDKATLWLDYNKNGKQEADFKIGRKTIKLTDLKCELETPSWYTERLSGVILKSDLVYSQTLAEKLKLLESYLKDAKSFGVKIEPDWNQVVLNVVLSDDSKITFEIKKINGWGKPFPDYENYLALVNSMIANREPSWVWKTFDLSLEEFNLLLGQPYLQGLSTNRTSEGSSGITFSSRYYDPK